MGERNGLPTICLGRPHHVDARYDGRDSMFLPPLRTIGFNPQLQMNDSLLALSYVEAYDISYPEALNRIADEVTEMRQTLENSGKFELNDIGTIILNEDGNYTFEPCEAGILTPELYGLGGLNMLPLAQISAEEAQKTEDSAASYIFIFFSLYCGISTPIISSAISSMLSPE